MHQGDPLGRRDAHRHEFVGLVRRVAEHEALVTSADDVAGLRDAAADVAALLGEASDDLAGLRVDACLGVAVADLPEHLARDGVCVALHPLDQTGHRGELPCDDNEVVVHQGLAGHPGVRVLGEEGIQDGVGYLVRDLVRVPLRDRFRGE